MAKSGIVYGTGSGGKLSDVITWHDLEELRVWIHSRAHGFGRSEIALEIQVVGLGSPPPSEEEKKVRLKLATIRTSRNVDHGIKSLILRTLPTGKLLDEHAQLVGNEVNQGRSGKKKVEIVKANQSRSFRELPILRWDTREELESEGAKSKDAIIIAKAYVMQQASGTKRLAKRTAELLQVDVAIVHLALQISRRNGWLTSKGSGVSGGDLTPEGEKKFLAAGGEKILWRFMQMGE